MEYFAKLITTIEPYPFFVKYTAGWEEARRIKFEQGFTTPAPMDYVGVGSLTQPESLALYNFTLEHNFGLVIAYHTQGQEIHFYFNSS